MQARARSRHLYVSGIVPDHGLGATHDMSAEDTLESWSEKVAALGVDVLVDNGLIQKADFERATSIVAEEIRIRLALGDYPPRENRKPSPHDR